MQFFRHFSYRSFLTRAVMGISALCLFASQGLSVSAATIKEENIARNQALAIQSNEVANWPTGPVVSAESAILMDADTGAILYAKNIHEKLYLIFRRFDIAHIQYPHLLNATVVSQLHLLME